MTGERRIVTILFSDVKGSTTFSEHLDPEEVMEIMNGAFDVLIAPITHYEGALARLMGDGILAFFGAPIAHEDDAERACRAALDIIARAQEYAIRLEEERGISGFSVRVGIHTGLVVVGEVGSDLRVEYTAMGDAVNLASRIEGVAEPGTVLITEDTHRLIAPLFETESLGPIEVRGRREPVAVYRVLAPRAVAGKARGIEGLESPLVGRDTELQALREVLEQLQAGVGGIVTVVGEAGIGKSRLVAELRKETAPRGVRWMEGRCLSYGESMAYLPWVDMLRGLLNRSMEDSPSAVHDTLRRWLQAFCPDQFDAVYPYLGRMMSLPLVEKAEDKLRGLDPEALKFLTFRALETMIDCTAAQGPLVLICEDLHWADPTSLELLERLLALTDRAALLIICAFRPYTEHGCWRIRETAARLYRHRHTDLRIAPLSAVESQVLVGNLLRVEALPAELRERILDHAEGNPFYVEEVIRSLIDSEAITCDEATARWRATQEVADIAIPDTLQGVLMARIDRLQEQTKRVLQMASVIGRTFLYRILDAIAREIRGLDEDLLILQREEMIRQRARVPELEYIFKHHLIQEAAYNGLLRSERRLLHRQIAEALERLFPNRLEEQLGLVAYHWEQARERQRAIEYLRRAGEQAAAQFANAEAVGYFSRALDLTPREDLVGRYELLLARERVHNVMAMREVQAEDLVALEALAQALNDDHQWAEVALRQARYAIQTSDYPATIAAAQSALRFSQAVQDVRREAAGYRYWGLALLDQGNYDAARSVLEHALALSRAAGSREEEGLTLKRLAHVRLTEHDYVEARAYYEEARRVYREMGDRRGELTGEYVYVGLGELDEARAILVERLNTEREMGDRRSEGWSTLWLGLVFWCLGRYDRARPYFEQGHRTLRGAGHPRGEAFALTLLGLLSHYLGDNEAARDYGREAAVVGQDAADPHQQAWGLTALGHGLAGLGCFEEAGDAYRRALLLRQQLREEFLATELLAGLARVSLAQGDLIQAQRHVEEILSYLEEDNLDGVVDAGLVYLSCYRVLEGAGDPRAHDILEEAHSLLQERAAKISDEKERRSFLENVAANRELASEYALVGVR